jgi:hypothetical protein
MSDQCKSRENEEDVFGVIISLDCWLLQEADDYQSKELLVLETY